MTLTSLLMGLVAVLYGAAGQAGGSGFVAVMTIGHVGADEIRATAFALNIVAASYATLRIQLAKLANWKLLSLLLASSVPSAMLSGMISLQGRVYFGITGAILLGIAGLMTFRGPTLAPEPISSSGAPSVGAVTGLVSGLTGVGGGIFLSSILILTAKASPRDVVALSPPFILANSIAALAGLLVAGQSFPAAALGLSGAVLVGSAIGSAIGLRWMSAAAIRAVLVLILLAGGIQMLIRATA